MKPATLAPIYAGAAHLMAEAAREVGYALAVHGTLTRDLDLIAVPWTEEAVSAEQLVMRLMSVTGGYLLDGGKQMPSGEMKHSRGDQPEPKPHGRLAWTIHLGGGAFIDLSVMPRKV